MKNLIYYLNNISVSWQGGATNNRLTGLAASEYGELHMGAYLQHPLNEVIVKLYIVLL